MQSSGELPDGVTLRQLTPFSDHRGTIVELDRASWHSDHPPVQWTALHSSARVLRGAHLHKQHTDQLVVTSGTLLVGLVDLRRASATPGLRMMFELAEFCVLTIPPLVAHTFYSVTDTATVNATSHEYDPNDDLEVQFDDPAFGFSWPDDAASLLSERDRSAPDLATLLDRCRAAGLDVVAGIA